MVLIHTSDDILRVLRERPEWKAEVRREILSEELMNLPGRFDEFAGKTEQFIQEQRQFNDEQRQFNDDTREFITEQRQFNDDPRELITEQRQFNDEQRQFNDEQRQFNSEIGGRVDHLESDVREIRGDVEQLKEDVGQLKEDVGQLKNDVRTIRDDLGDLKGFRARDETIKQADGIAMMMGFQMVRTLSYGDLVSMTVTAETSGIADGDIQSFRSADLVIEATDANGETHYIAMEISYTGDARDTRRAIRNAGLLTRFTGHPARAAIASIQNVNEIQDTIDSGQVYWHRLVDRDSRPE